MSDDLKKGWHPDPFGHYAERYYYADGEPGRLVRDDGRREFYDDLPVTAPSTDATRVPPAVRSRPTRRLPSLEPVHSPPPPPQWEASDPTAIESGDQDAHREFDQPAELLPPRQDDSTHWGEREADDYFPDERVPWRILVASRLRNLSRPSLSWPSRDRLKMPSRRTLYTIGTVLGMVVLGIVLVVVVTSGPGNSPTASTTASKSPQSVPPTQPPSSMLNGGRGAHTTSSSPSTTTTLAAAPAAATQNWATNSSYAASALTLTGITCPSTTHCFAVGETALKSAMVLASTDGGTTWSQQNIRVPGALTAIGCSSPTACVAVGGTSVVITSDGGTTWTPRQLGSNTLTGIACPTTTTCVAVGSDVPQTSGCDSGVTYATHNGGQSWSPTATRCFVPSGVSCSSAARCMASGIHTTGTANYGAVMQTTNAGGIWKWADVLAQSNTQLAAISCPTTETCVAVGSSATQPIVRTANAGATWTPAAPTSPGSTPDNYLTVSCASATACQAGGLQGAVSTADGTTWTSAALPALIIKVTGIACPAAGQCNGVAIGQLAAPWTLTLAAA